jgi:hypothetical protein
MEFRNEFHVSGFYFLNVTQTPPEGILVCLPNKSDVWRFTFEDNNYRSRFRLSIDKERGETS